MSADRGETGGGNLPFALGVVLLPVYRWGAIGDPREERNAPNPDHKEYPAGRESLVGSHGFGVIVRGEHLADFDLHDGDVAWCNPSAPAPHGRPAAICSNDGLIVKVAEDGDDTVGPVVWVTTGRPPGWGHPPN